MIANNDYPLHEVGVVAGIRTALDSIRLISLSCGTALLLSVAGAQAKDPTAIPEADASRSPSGLSSGPAQSLAGSCDLEVQWEPKAHCSGTLQGPYKVALWARNVGTATCPQRDIEVKMACSPGFFKVLEKRTLISLGPNQVASGAAALVWVVDQQTLSTCPTLATKTSHYHEFKVLSHKDANSANHATKKYEVNFAHCP